MLVNQAGAASPIDERAAARVIADEASGSLGNRNGSWTLSEGSSAMGEKVMMDFNAVPLPLSLQAELAKQRTRRLQRVKERPARKDDEVGHDPETAEPIDGEAEKAKRREKAVIANLKALR